MKKFAHLIHLDGPEHFFTALERKYRREIKRRPIALIKKYFEWINPVVWKEFEIVSKTGKRVLGALVLCPLLPNQFVTLPEEFIMEKLLLSAQTADWWGAELIGLGGFTSIVCDQGEKIAGRIRQSVTTGNTYTAMAGVMGVKMACEKIGVDMEKSTLAVLGAGGDIGSAAAVYLSKSFSRVILTGRQLENLSAAAEEIKKTAPRTAVEITDQAGKAAERSDVILSAVSAVNPIVDHKMLKPGAVFCDISIPKSISRVQSAERDDLLIFDGGMIKAPNEVDLTEETEEAPGMLFGCLAESAVLTLEDRSDNFSIGRGKIKFDKMEEIYNLGEKHGFSLAPFCSGKRFYTEEDFERLKRIVKAGG